MNSVSEIYLTLSKSVLAYFVKVVADFDEIIIFYILNNSNIKLESSG